MFNGKRHSLRYASFPNKGPVFINERRPQSAYYLGEGRPSGLKELLWVVALSNIECNFLERERGDGLAMDTETLATALGEAAASGLNGAGARTSRAFARWRGTRLTNHMKPRGEVTLYRGRVRVGQRENSPKT